MNSLIKLLDQNIELEKFEIANDTIYLHCRSTLKEVACPYCKTLSDRVHSRYKKTFKDLPIQGKKVIVVLNNRKMFCDNPQCVKKLLQKGSPSFHLNLEKQSGLMMKL